MDVDYHVYASRFDRISNLSALELSNLIASLSIEPGFLILNFVISNFGFGSEAFFLFTQHLQFR